MAPAAAPLDTAGPAASTVRGQHRDMGGHLGDSWGHREHAGTLPAQ